jgi:hypothetical protein
MIYFKESLNTELVSGMEKQVHFMELEIILSLLKPPIHPVPWCLLNCITSLTSKGTSDLDTIHCSSWGKHPDTRLTEDYVNPRIIL